VSARPAGAGEADAPAAIVPRWEWRTFGEAFGGAERRFDELEPEEVTEGDELYLLSAGSDASVKVRHGKLDVKRLQRVDERGLEQWRPVLKASFPLSADDARVVLEALELPVPDLDRASFEVEDLVRLGAREVAVHKLRRHYTLEGCLAELSEVSVADGATRTIAVESEDTDRVAAAVRSLGLPLQPNTCMARGLKALVGARYAVIDVGTNSVKFYVARRNPDGSWETIVDRSEVTRLGQGLEKTGRLAKAAVERTAAAIEAMVEEARRDGVEHVAAVGTAGLRIAPNRDELLDEVERRTGVRIEVIPGEEEARLSYVATREALGLGSEAADVFETGGGSTQFTFGHGDRIDEQFSLDVGAVRYTEEFGLDRAVDEARLDEALAAIADALSPLNGRPTPDRLVGMGGAVTNLAAVAQQLDPYDPDRIRGYELERAEVERQVELYRTRDADARRGIAGLQPKRAEIILAGACVVLAVMRKLASESLTVSDRGLRHGLMAERFGGGA
jgi:exopolyphosphatase / guanosine-5'-triphosphate,3'-diphosphate pyrophosphatase